MIISHKHKFIFIKTNKTAGTSIEIALSKHCGPDDVITPISPEDEMIRKTYGYRGPQNFSFDQSLNVMEDSRRHSISPIRRGAIQCYNHMSAIEIKEVISNEIWDNYFKFCFERNPWDRVISMYYWKFQAEPRPTISDFLNSDTVLLLKKRGSDLYKINEKIVVDNICKYENISDEMEAIRTLVGIPEPLNLPKAKSGFRIDKRNYSEILNESEKIKIADIFSEEIKRFGYRY